MGVAGWWNPSSTGRNFQTEGPGEVTSAALQIYDPTIPTLPLSTLRSESTSSVNGHFV